MSNNIKLGVYATGNDLKEVYDEIGALWAAAGKLEKAAQAVAIYQKVGALWETIPGESAKANHAKLHAEAAKMKTGEAELSKEMEHAAASYDEVKKAIGWYESIKEICTHNELPLPKTLHKYGTQKEDFSEIEEQLSVLLNEMEDILKKAHDIGDESCDAKTEDALLGDAKKALKKMLNIFEKYEVEKITSPVQKMINEEYAKWSKGGHSEFMAKKLKEHKEGKFYYTGSYVSR